jgi:hypothetical protein
VHSRVTETLQQEETQMQEASRVQRWRANKRQQGLKALTVWVTEEEELRLKDLALQWHCSPSQLMQRALAQVGTPAAPQNGSPPDTSLIRELIRAELAAMQAAPTTVTEAVTVGPSDTQATNTPAPRPAPGQTKLTPLQVGELRGKRSAGVPIKELMAEYDISRATLFRYLKES